jgi:phosphoglycerate dehydrogenase-like enzyme
MLRVLVADSRFKPGAAAGLALLEQAGIDLRFAPCGSSTSAAELIGHLDGCVASLAGSEKYTHEVFEAVPHLRHIARMGVGYDAIDLHAACNVRESAPQATCRL